MAISSLSKFTVPLPSGQSATNQGLLFPKLKYRFRVILENFGLSKPSTELTKQVVNCSRPEVSFENKELHIYNSRINYAGKYSWNEITVTLRDDVTNSVSKLVGEQVQKQFDFFEQSSAASGSDYKFVTKIEMLDGGNGVNEAGILETFELYGCYVTKAKYDDAAYDSSDPITISISLKYDNAIQVNESGQPVGIGAQVGRTIRTLATG
jgi:hypothetical protein